jgi:hypothetical protein
MAEKKQSDQAPSTTGAAEKRKPWVKKDAGESMLALIDKQEKRVAKMRQELEKESKQLEKLQRAKKILESAS